MGKKLIITYWTFRFLAVFAATIIVLASLVLAKVLEWERVHYIITRITRIDIPLNTSLALVIAFFSLAAITLVTIVEFIKADYFWAWWAAIVICIFFCSSLLLPFGVLGFVGLLERETRRHFFWG